jgi:hypothetical protein
MGTGHIFLSHTYDLLGNITSGPLGAYGYTGNTGVSYAEPGAATAVASRTLTYDNNGNLTSLGTNTYPGTIATASPNLETASQVRVTAMMTRICASG